MRDEVRNEMEEEKNEMEEEKNEMEEERKNEMEEERKNEMEDERAEVGDDMREEIKNEMEMTFDAISLNESLARICVAAFITQLNPTLEEMADIKTAVSEAVTNAIIHGYGNLYGYHTRLNREEKEKTAGTNIREGKVTLRCRLADGILFVDVEDKGSGIENIEKAMEPLFTTKPELERSGMGFSFMEAFMDDLQVESTPGVGTIVHMQKKLRCGSWIPHKKEDE